MVAYTDRGRFERYFVPTFAGGRVFRLTEYTQRFSTLEEAQYAVRLWGGVYRKYTIYTEAEAEALVALCELAEVE